MGAGDHPVDSWLRTRGCLRGEVMNTTVIAREIEFTITNGTLAVKGEVIRPEVIEAMCLDITDEDRACGVLLAEIDFDVEADIRAGRPGRYWGAPEDCYPDEPAEVEILRVSLGPVELTAQEEALLLGEIDEDALVAEAEEAWADARAEAMYDRY